MRRPCYIAGPYAADTPEGIRRNVSRAVALGRLAAEQGYTPVCSHAMGYLGAYGDPLEADDATRAAALECGQALAALVGREDIRTCPDGWKAHPSMGPMWVILRGDHTESQGVSQETAAFAREGGIDGRAMAWRFWCAEFPQLIDWALRIEARLSVLVP